MKEPTAYAHKCDHDTFGRVYYISNPLINGAVYSCENCGSEVDDVPSDGLVDVGPHPSVTTDQSKECYE